MPKRFVLLTVMGVVALGVVGYLVFARLSDLENQVAGLGRQLTKTEQQLAEAETRAVAAANAAAAATAEAEQAENEASAARISASVAAERVVEARQEARQATDERAAAERARGTAEVARVEAETESIAARADAVAARNAESVARQEARVARQEAEDIRHRREIELNRMQEAFSKIVETRRTAIGIVLNLGSDRVEFEFDKAELRSEERELLARIAGVLLATADQGYAIQVFGHTDDVGTEEYNKGLSERRAGVVRDYLVEAGVNPDIVTMQGLGKSMPLIAETTDEARERNRRVEIAIIDTMIEYRAIRR